MSISFDKIDSILNVLWPNDMEDHKKLFMQKLKEEHLEEDDNKDDYDKLFRWKIIFDLLRQVEEELQLQNDVAMVEDIDIQTECIKTDNIFMHINGMNNKLKYLLTGKL